MSALSRKRKYNQYVLQSLCAPLVIWIHSPPPHTPAIADLVFESRVFLLHKLAVFRSRREIALFAGDINISLVVWQRGQQAGNTCVQQRNPRKVHYTKPAQTLFPGGLGSKKTHTHTQLLDIWSCAVFTLLLWIGVFFPSLTVIHLTSQLWHMTLNNGENTFSISHCVSQRRTGPSWD